MSVIIRLQGLPLSASSADIRSFFGGLRIPDGAVNIVGGELGDAFIGFLEDEDARQAMRKNNGLIHGSEVRLFLSSMKEMKEVIDTASRPAPPPANPPRYGGTMQSPPFERGEPPRYPPRDDPSRFGGDGPTFGGNEAPFSREEHLRYGRDGGPPHMNNSGRPFFPPHGGLPTDTRSIYTNGPRFDERRDMRQEGTRRDHMDKSHFDHSFGSEKILPKTSRNEDEMVGRHVPYMSKNAEPLGDMHQNNGGGYMQSLSRSMQQGGDAHNLVQSRILESGAYGNGREDGNKMNEAGKKEESWRSDTHRSFDRLPPMASIPPVEKEEEQISFFGRGTSVPKRPLLPPPSLHPPPFIPPPQPSPNMSTTKESAMKEEVFIELTRLPPDLLRPSVLEEFLSPATPLTLSSVKVVYSPEGIHLHSLVRFTNALDAFNSLKKDGEQGVKIRPSTRDMFERARDGPPSTISNVPSMPPMLPFPPFAPPMGAMPPPMGGMPPQMGGMPPHARPNLFTMPLINPNEMMMGNEGGRISGARNELDESREGERRKREESPPRGRREERGSRTKRPRPERYCAVLSNIPFRAKENEIRRMLGPRHNPNAIKKIFNEDNSPSDVWILEFSSEVEANETVRRRMDMGGRPARMRRVDEPEADRLLRQKFKSPPRRAEKEEDKRDSFDDKVRMQQEAIEKEKMRMKEEEQSGEKAVEGAFSTPVFTNSRGFMRGGRGGGRGVMRGGRGRGASQTFNRFDNREGGGERNCLLISNMPSLPVPQILLEHLRVNPSHFVRVDQIAPDAAIIELKREVDAIGVAETASGPMFPPINGRRLIVAAMSRRQIEEEFNVRVGQMNANNGSNGHYRPRIDPEIVRSVGEVGCVIACDGFPRDLAIDEVKAFFDGFPIVETSVRMRMEGGVGTGECLLAFTDSQSARRAVQSHNGRMFRHCPVTLTLFS